VQQIGDFVFRIEGIFQHGSPVPSIPMTSHVCLIPLSDCDLECLQGAGHKHGHDKHGHAKKQAKGSDLLALLGDRSVMQSLLGQLNISIINFFGVQNAAATVVQGNAAYGAML
jgi:hypothetical protein